MGINNSIQYRFKQVILRSKHGNGFSLVIILHFFFIFFLGCNTASQVDISSYSEKPGDYSLERINTLLDGEEFLRAMTLIQRQKADGKNVTNMKERALEGIRRAYTLAMEKSQWQKVINYHRSLKLLDALPETIEISETDLLLQGVDQYFDSEKSGAAASLLQSQVNIEDLSEDTRSKLAQQFRESGHLTAAKNLDGQDFVEPEIPNLIDGTVTVWVNRGIRLVGRIGIPDRGIGSGFFIDPSGYIITNYHVISSEVDPEYKGFSRLFIKFDNESQERIPAKVIGWERNLDLALLKTEMKVPYVFNSAWSNPPKPGETVKAIGSPGGFIRSLTTGTISALKRSIQPMSNALQVDVPVNPGNSGGPLLNSSGEVIGVIFAGIREFEGINFAIPGTYLSKITHLLYEKGEVEIPWLGVVVWEISNKLEIIYVVPNSPAADAGLQVGDNILKIDNKDFNDVRDIQEYLLGRQPGTLAKVEWQRNENTHEGFPAFAVRPDIPLEHAINNDVRDNLLAPLFGIFAIKINDSIFSQRYRIVSVLPGSLADESGFIKDDTFSILRWIVDTENKFVSLQMVVKNRKAGFLESPIQIRNYLNIHQVF